MFPLVAVSSHQRPKEDGRRAPRVELYRSVLESPVRHLNVHLVEVHCDDQWLVGEDGMGHESPIATSEGGGVIRVVRSGAARMCVVGQIAGPIARTDLSF